jgi:hypothetical protein
VKVEAPKSTSPVCPVVVVPEEATEPVPLACAVWSTGAVEAIPAYSCSVRLTLPVAVRVTVTCRLLPPFTFDA